MTEKIELPAAEKGARRQNYTDLEFLQVYLMVECDRHLNEDGLRQLIRKASQVYLGDDAPLPRPGTPEWLATLAAQVDNARTQSLERGVGQIVLRLMEEAKSEIP